MQKSKNIFRSGFYEEYDNMIYSEYSVFTNEKYISASDINTRKSLVTKITNKSFTTLTTTAAPDFPDQTLRNTTKAEGFPIVSGMPLATRV